MAPLPLPRGRLTLTTALGPEAEALLAGEEGDTSPPSTEALLQWAWAPTCGVPRPRPRP